MARKVKKKTKRNLEKRFAAATPAMPAPFVDRREYEDRRSDQETAKHPVASTYRNTRKPGKAPRGDGLSYEAAGVDVSEFDLEPEQIMRLTAWMPASPFAVTLLKELIIRLEEISGWSGTSFLSQFGASNTDDLSIINDMHIDSVIELIDEAVLSIPFNCLARLGYDDVILGLRGRAHERRKQHIGMWSRKI